MDFAAIKQGQRAMWGMGDFADLARHTQQAADVAVEAVGATPQESLLDVATGTGNAAITAAQMGLRATGLDLTPELLEKARTRSAAQGLSIDWVEGDAEALPFEDASFDRVTSVFGVMFAPRHEVAAAELTRVLRPGGKFAVAAWTPEGLVGSTFRAMSEHMPPPPPELRPPPLWGSEEHVQALFPGAELEFRRMHATFEAPSVQAWMDYNERVLPPLVAMRGAFATEPELWQAIRDDLSRVYESCNEAADGTMLCRGEYLLTVGRA